MVRKIFFIFLVCGILAVTLAQASTWEDDPAHSSIEFKVRHMMISNVKGSFDSFTVSLNYDDKDVAKSSVETVIQAASISTGVERRDNDLKGPKYLDVAKYPELRFVSKRVQKVGAGLQIIGDLTIHGITREVVVNVSEITPPSPDPWGGVRMGASAAALVKRSDFGLTYNQVLETGGVVVGDEVAINIEMEFIKK